MPHFPVHNTTPTKTKVTIASFRNARNGGPHQLENNISQPRSPSLRSDCFDRLLDDFDWGVRAAGTPTRRMPATPMKRMGGLFHTPRNSPTRPSSGQNSLPLPGDGETCDIIDSPVKIFDLKRKNWRWHPYGASVSPSCEKDLLAVEPRSFSDSSPVFPRNFSPTHFFLEEERDRDLDNSTKTTAFAVERHLQEPMPMAGCERQMIEINDHNSFSHFPNNATNEDHMNLFVVVVDQCGLFPRRYLSHTGYELGSYVVTEGDRGVNYGEVVDCYSITAAEHAAAEHQEGLQFVLRLASRHQIAQFHLLRSENAKALALLKSLKAGDVVGCDLRKFRFHRAEWQGDKEKLTVYYSTKEKATYKPLCCFLNHIYRCRIQMVGD